MEKKKISLILNLMLVMLLVFSGFAFASDEENMEPVYYKEYAADELFVTTDQDTKNLIPNMINVGVAEFDTDLDQKLDKLTVRVNNVGIDSLDLVTLHVQLYREDGARMCDVTRYSSVSIFRDWVENFSVPEYANGHIWITVQEGTQIKYGHILLPQHP